MDNLSINLLLSWVSWMKKCKVHSIRSTPSVNYTILVSGFMIQLGISSRLRRNNRLWWLLGLSEQFFDFLLKENFSGLVHVVQDILADRPPIPHPEDLTTGEPSVDLYDEYGIAMFQKNSKEAVLAEQLIYGLVTSHILGAFKVFLDRIAEVMNISNLFESTFGFLRHSLEKQFTGFVYHLHQQATRDWKKLGMTVSSMPAYLLEMELSDLWSLLKRTAHYRKALNAIISSQSRSDIPDDTDVGEEENEVEDRVRSNLLVSSQLPILSFAINPLDRNQIAYVTTRSINEINAQVSSFYYEVL